MHTYNPEQRLLYHCAPTLLGVKSASMFSLSGLAGKNLSYILSSYTHLIKPLGLRVTALCRCDDSALIYVYSKKRLERILDAPDASAFLKDCGYDGCRSADGYIGFLKTRFNISYAFPHEIGIFLDYPLKDVTGFIQNGGKNYIYCGDWKVYSQKTDAVRRFNIYKKCRDFVSSMLENGMDACEILSLCMLHCAA